MLREQKQGFAYCQSQRDQMLQQFGHTWMRSLRISSGNIHRLLLCTVGLMVQADNLWTRIIVFFFPMSHLPCTLGFGKATWNVFPTSHGKRTPDGISGTVKRTAHNLVLKGNDVADRNTFFVNVSNSLKSIQLCYIAEEDMQRALKEANTPGHLTWEQHPPQMSSMLLPWDVGLPVLQPIYKAAQINLAPYFEFW